MSPPCCSRPISTKIKVGSSEAGILGLQEIFKNIPASLAADEEALRSELLALARDQGNYIAPSMEMSYEEAFLREYRQFVGRGEAGAAARTPGGSTKQ